MHERPKRHKVLFNEKRCMMEEKIVISKMQRGDTDALELIIEKYNNYVATIVVNILGGIMAREDIQEVINDVFFLLWKSVNKIDTDTYPSIKGYLAVIAQNAAKSKLRTIKKETAFKEDVFSDSVDEIERSDTREWVISCIRQLNRYEQIVLVKYYYQNKSIKKIAEEEGIPESTVKTRMRRGKEHLRELLEKGE